MRAHFRSAGVAPSDRRDLESGTTQSSRGGGAGGGTALHPVGFSTKLIEETADFFEAGERNASICFACESLRGIRVKHCPYCDRCVDRLDHHRCATTGVGGKCVGTDFVVCCAAVIVIVHNGVDICCMGCACSNWIGNCIGRKNHRMFLTWAAVQLVTELFMTFFLYEVLADIAARQGSVGSFIGHCLFVRYGVLLAFLSSVGAILLSVTILRMQYMHIANNLTLLEVRPVWRSRFLHLRCTCR